MQPVDISFFGLRYKTFPNMGIGFSYAINKFHTSWQSIDVNNLLITYHAQNGIHSFDIMRNIPA
jgi:hypothetical protein